MDKMTRLLLLYSKLMRGEKVNKTLFCLEADCLPRSFDRDVEDVRLFLSDSFAAEELIYDRGEKVYFLNGTHRGELDATECLFLECLLRDASLLGEEEFQELLSHLYSVSIRQPEKRMPERYVPPTHGRPILKLFGDLQTVLHRGLVISLIATDERGAECEETVIPYEIRAAEHHLIFFARPETAVAPKSYPLEEIRSFQVLREMTFAERQQVKAYLEEKAKKSK